MMSKPLKNKIALFLLGSTLLTHPNFSAAVLPSEIFPDGLEHLQTLDAGTGRSITIRKGSTKAAIDNMLRFNEVIQTTSSSQRTLQAKEIIATLTTLIETLKDTKTFEFFEPIEWLQDSNNEGRILTANLYLRSPGATFSPLLRERLEALKPVVSLELSKEIEHCLNRTPLNITEADEVITRSLTAITAEKVSPGQIDVVELEDPYTKRLIPVRKGTVGAMRLNADSLTTLLNSADDVLQRSQQIESLLKDTRELIAPLSAAGMFTFFKPEEWLNTPSNFGRALVAGLLLEQHPELITPLAQERLASLSPVKEWLNLPKNRVLN